MTHLISFPNLGAKAQGTDRASGHQSSGENAEVKRAAQEFEAIMLSQLTAALRSEPSDDEDSLFGSGESDLPQQMFGEQLAMSMAKGGGIGVAELIAHELNPAKGESSAKASPINGANEAVRHLRGPLPAQPPADAVSTLNIVPKPVDPLLEMTRPRRVADLARSESTSRPDAVKLPPIAETQTIKRAFEQPVNKLADNRISDNKISDNKISEPAYTGQRKIDEIIEQASARHGLDPHLIAAILHTESGGKQTAVSHKGASGYMQMMPATFREFAGPGQNIFDAKDNISAGASYLKHLSDKYKGKLDKILAAYNAGSGNVDKYGGVPPFKETRNFVASVKHRYKEALAAAEPSSIASSKGLGIEASRVKSEVASARPAELRDSRDLITTGRARRAERQVIVLRNETSEASAEPVDLQIPVQGRISSPFGARRNHGNHKGVDIAVAKGTPIEASANGQVVYAGWSRGYGKTVLIKHQEGVYTRYAHAENILVSRGDTVQTGQQVATVGSTGHATGPHLHFEVIKGSQRINPLSAMNPLRSMADSPVQRVAIKIGK